MSWHGAEKTLTLDENIIPRENISHARVSKTNSGSYKIYFYLKHALDNAIAYSTNFADCETAIKTAEVMLS